MVLDVFIVIALLILIVLASGVVVDVFEKFVGRLPIEKKKVNSILIGFSLALPELFVGIAAAIEGKPQIALGNVVGANMVNLSLVIGGLAIVSSVVPVVGEYLEKDFWIAIGLALLPFIMLFFGIISRFEGFVLVAIYFIYAIYSDSRSSVKQSKRKMEIFESLGLVVILILGLLIMAASSWQLVQIAVRIATYWSFSWFWMGLLLISLGTTLPELLLISLFRKKQKASIVLTDLLESVAMNSTLVLGVTAIITPIVMKESIQTGLSSIFLVVIMGLFWLFTKSKKKLERWEGVVLIGIYLMFIGLQFIFA